MPLPKLHKVFLISFVSLNFSISEKSGGILLDIYPLTDSFVCLAVIGGDILPCYHPRPMVQDGFTSSGKPKYSFVPAQQILHCSSDQLAEIERLGYKDKVISVPCKKCIGCKLDYSRKWADRLMLELDHSKVAIFVTLTYKDEDLTPGDLVTVFDVDSLTGEAFERLTCFPTLVKKDVQDFNKRLRERFSDKQIRFYLAGEYGPKTNRPHYHAIYFGLSLNDFPDKQLLGCNRHNQPLFTSDKLTEIWSHGHVSIANVSWQSCAYVARYSLKKMGAAKFDKSSSRGVLDEFSLMSRRPGIAGYFPVDHPEVFDNPNDKIYLTDPYGVTSKGSISLPSYLFEKLELINPELYFIIKEQRKLSMNDSFLMELSKTDLDEVSYLDLKERIHEKSVSSLKRELLD